MTVHCFTSASFSYLAKARVLGTTLKRFHPDWVITFVLTDSEPPDFKFDLSCEPFDQVIRAAELPVSNVNGWLFQHEVVEACTAVKGPALKLLLDRGADKVFYLDPDIAVFESLEPLTGMLEDASILLTPHQLTPEDARQAIIDNEICSLSHGAYNLGFIGVRNDNAGRQMANWWSDRLLEYCVDDRPAGIFVDQKWCDLVPAMFDNVKILRDPGYNVASWNLSNRKIAIDAAGACTANGSPLRFFHFTKLGPIGDMMTRKYAAGNLEVYELWAWYKRAVDRLTDPRIPAGWWHYGQFDNGTRIPRQVRLLYRDRADLRKAFPNPFETGGESYLGWLKENGHMAGR